MGKKKGRTPRKSAEPSAPVPNTENPEDFPSLGSGSGTPARVPVEPTPISVPSPQPVITSQSQSAQPESIQSTPGPIPSEPIVEVQSAATLEPQPSASKPHKTEKDEAQEVVKHVKELFVPERHERRNFPKRPDNGLTIGTPLTLLANHFLLKVGKKKAYHYDLEIEKAFKKNATDSNVVDKDVEESNVLEKKKDQFAKKIATRLNRKIFQNMIEFYSVNDNRVFNGINPVYDGQKNMFTSKILNGTENKQTLRLKVELKDEGRDSAFYVNIKLTETNEVINLDILNLYHKGQTCDDEVLKKSVLFINTLLRHNSTMDWVPIGQSIFDPNSNGQRLGQYLVLTYGFYTSVRNLMVGPTLNIDRSAAAFYDSNICLQILMGNIIKCDLSRMPANTFTDYHRRKIKRELSGLQVEARHIQYGDTYRKYRILGLTKESAKDIKFKWQEKTREGEMVVKQELISVADYFMKKYKQVLKFPQLPCLEVGNPNNVVKLPLEMCRLVPHQRLRRTMTSGERSEMTRASGQQFPRDRLQMSQDFIANQFHIGPMGLKNKPFLSEFEINVDQNLLKVNSKVIPPPNLMYGNNQSVIPRNGEWEMYKIGRNGAPFLKPARLENWIVINMSFTDSILDQDVELFCKDLCNQANEMGMFTTPPKNRVVIRSFKPKVTFNGIKAKLKDMKGLKMILFITPDKAHECSDEIYSEIKLLGDVEFLGGLTTQCVNILSIWNPRSRDPKRLQKWNRSYLRQIMLKVNPKLGGINVALVNNSSMPSIFKNKYMMIMGADVNHPAPADKISPSIAALVSSYDNEYSNYYTTVSMQPKSREEMIQNLDKMAVESLRNYLSKHKVLPQQIIFYRDGVSEGQFQHVIDNEYPLLTKAFTQLNPKYKPKLTFIVVQKRHHTRFITADRKENVPPGTVVEKDITHKRDFDFYLCSHAGRIGTSRSAHYYVLADENNFSSNDMCIMTYHLCHIYQRCTKSVSIPAPVYYADLAAYRAKVHASPHLCGSENASVFSDEGGDESQIRNFKDMIKVSDAQKQKLYFC